MWLSTYLSNTIITLPIELNGWWLPGFMIGPKYQHHDYFQAILGVGIAQTPASRQPGLKTEPTQPLTVSITLVQTIPPEKP